MLDTLRRIIGEFAGGSPSFAAEDYRVAAAALLVHVITADGTVEPSERQRLLGVLEQRYGLDAADARALVTLAEERNNEALDLSEFTSVLKRALDAEGRIALVEMLWEMAGADGDIHEFEEGLIDRAGDLLGVSAAESASARARVIGPGAAGT